ncbi:hypothetical protein ABFS82_12G056500 [Erythranthe guttata]|uniref:uncharacterized protein At5g23160 n=1 Tax=Erythranthe guttata TaxID=4155 RepID=UPI00064DDF5F|nr:PREDICTED: uncharacterized protein At5g23160 [Erythranthe guttata]|eukprot:XP_012834983.1 PREDICTED: uncharacterized protein At5g23160 [Erythranthe guttata]
MAEVNNKHKRKGRKNNRKRFLCFFGSCFGISSKVSADHGGRKSVKDSNEYNSLGEKAVNDQRLTSLSSEIKSSNGEILVIEEAEAHHQDDETIMLLDPPPTAHQVLINPKSKNLDESADVETPVEDNNVGQERRCKTTTKLSHVVPLPLPRPKKEKPTTDGGSESKNGNKLIMAAEFDSVVGALIIMVTLIVMLIWGKICATICAAAWIYFFPRFRANINKSYIIKHKYDRDLVNFDSLGVQEKGGFTRII